MDGTSLAKLAVTPATGGDYRALFDHLTIPLAVVAVRGGPHFVAASRGFLDTFDLGRRAVVGRTLDDVLAPESSAILATAINRCLVTSETLQTTVERRVRGSHGVIRLALHSARARGFAGHVVLEAKNRGHAIHSAEQRLSPLVDQAGGSGQSMAYIHDLSSDRIRYVDGGLARRLGLSGGSMHLRDIQAKVHPEDLGNQAAHETNRELLREDESATRTLRVRDQQGEWLLISLRSRVLRRGRDGGARLIIGSATDITGYAAAAVEAAGVSVLRAEENERARIGRELHDSTSQYLVAADLGLARVLRAGGLSDDEQARLQGVQASLATAQREMRAFAYFLHPPELRELGLLKTIEKFSAGFARRSGLEITFGSSDVPKQISSDTEHALFRVCQEALMNVYRHAFARQVSVTLQLQGDQLVLEVRDDGIGVDGVDRFEHGGMGVAGMKSRMLSVGGDLSLDYLGPGLAVVARAPTLPVATRY